MPEGDTIWRAAAMLRDALAGKQVKQARPDGLRRLTGATVTAVEPTGKHLVIRFDNGYALHSHMRMRGVWRVYPPGERGHPPQGQLKAMLQTADGVAVCFRAAAGEPARHAPGRIRHLRPDPLRAAWNADEGGARARQLH